MEYVNLGRFDEAMEEFRSLDWFESGLLGRLLPWRPDA